VEPGAAKRATKVAGVTLTGLLAALLMASAAAGDGDLPSPGSPLPASGHDTAADSLDMRPAADTLAAPASRPGSADSLASRPSPADTLAPRMTAVDSAAAPATADTLATSARESQPQTGPQEHVASAPAAPAPRIALAPPLTPPSPAGTARGMADTVTMLPPVRVDADRAHTDGRPAATSVRLDRSQLMRFQPASTADAMLAAPGLDVSRTGPWASHVALRGLSGERVLVLVDGVRLQSGRGHGAQTSLVPVERLESVELLPGGNSAEFGSDALAGVVELRTHRDLLARRGTALLVTGRSGGPGGERSGLVRLRSVWPGIGAEVSAGRGALDALVTPDGRVPHSGYRDADAMARVQARLGASLLDLEHTRHVASDIQLPAFDNAAGSFAEYPQQARDASRLEWSLPRGGRRPEMRLLAVHQRFRTDFVESVTDSQFLRSRFVGTRTSRADDRIDTRSTSLQPTFRLGDTRLYGEYRHEGTRGPRATDVSVWNTAGAQVSASRETGESVPPARRDLLAGGVATALRWGMWRLDAGARHDWMHSRADSTPVSFTSRLDVVDERTSVDAGLSATFGAVAPYARAATGFRAPNLEERYFNDEIHGGLRLFGNPDLRAERSRTLELGTRMQASGRFGLEGARLSLYRSEVRDLITLRYLGQLYLVPRFQYTNVERARLEGVEFEASGAAGPMKLSAGAAFPRGRDLATGEPLTDVGAARVTLDARVPVGRWLPYGQLALRGRWTNATLQDDPLLARPAFWTASAELSCVAWDTRWSLSVRNLTDTRYREPMSFIDEPGRSVSLSVRREFQWR